MNVLEHASGEWVWVDWQEVGMDKGTKDLSFFYQRATAVGGKVTLASLVDAYWEELEHQTGKSLDLAVLQRSAELYELTSRLFHWPQYLENAPDFRIREHVSRVMDLLEIFEIA